MTLAGCASEPPPKPAKAPSSDGVPVNSDAENKDANEERRKRALEAPPPPAFATQPSGGGGGAVADVPPPSGGTSTPGSTTAASGKSDKPDGKTGKKADALKGGKVSKAECEKVLDRGIDLQFAAQPGMKDMVAALKQAGQLDAIKQQARQQAGAGKDPCDSDGVTRSQYTCGMAATTADAWKNCMQ